MGVSTVFPQATRPLCHRNCIVPLVILVTRQLTLGWKEQTTI
jgi:hypothetical protein